MEFQIHGHDVSIRKDPETGETEIEVQGCSPEEEDAIQAYIEEEGIASACLQNQTGFPKTTAEEILSKKTLPAGSQPQTLHKGHQVIVLFEDGTKECYRREGVQVLSVKNKTAKIRLGKKEITLQGVKQILKD